MSEAIKGYIGGLLPIPKKLRDLIREVRAAKTAAEERSVINKEAAYIREKFRQPDDGYRCRNMAKLLYIHMLGYPTQYGQVECMKLVASPKFTDKRIGYLGAMLLLDENSEVHLLITNSVKSDLSNGNEFIVALALCTLGNICSPHMARDLASDVERLIKSTNPYLRKKAILCASKMMSRVPDLLETFLPVTRMLLADKNHGVLVSAVTLIIHMCVLCPDALAHFKKVVPQLVRLLKQLIGSQYSADHDVSGVMDPFLQVKILKLLRQLGKDDHTTSDDMNDILAQVATNTETSKNVGHAILYEIVQTVMGIDSDKHLRVLAVNILGRFLLNSDKNIRYVALNTLGTVVNADYEAVQRHRSTIIDCLRDPDVSIRRRAMELSFQLVNAQNVRGMVKELLSFLADCEPEFRADCCSSLAIVVDQYAPDITWQLTTLIAMLKTAGNYVRDDVVAGTVQLVSQRPDLQRDAASRLLLAMRHDLTQQPLVQVACWCVGEYADQLVNETVTDLQTDESVHLTPTAIVDIVVSVLKSRQVSVTTKAYALTALAKLTDRFPSDSEKTKIDQSIAAYTTSVALDLQQRSNEYRRMCFLVDKVKSAGLFERMPVLENVNPTGSGAGASSSETSTGQKPNGILDDGALLDVDTHAETSNNPTSTVSSLQNDLVDVFSSDVLSQPPQTTSFDPLDSLAAISNDTTPATTSNTFDPLADLAGVLSTPSNNGVTHTQQTNGYSNKEPSSSIFSPVTVVTPQHGIQVTFALSKPKKDVIGAEAVILNTSADASYDAFVFEVAVPRAFQLDMQPPSGSLLQPNGANQITQRLTISNPQFEPVKMRLRFSFTSSTTGSKCQEQMNVSSFPAKLWQQ